MSWEIYIDDELANAQLEKIVDELDGIRYAYIRLGNTADNRELVYSDRSVEIKYDGSSVFEGTLTGARYYTDNLRAVVYDSVYYSMDGKIHTGSYSEVEADTILAAICADAGVSAGECPSTKLSMKFKGTDCWIAANFLAFALNEDFWTSDSSFNIGKRGTYKGEVTPASVSRREIDRSKRYNKVIYKGYDESGNEIEASASIEDGDRACVFFERRATDLSTLLNLAQKRLVELSSSTVSNKIVLSLDDGIFLNPGDEIAVYDERMELSSTYQIYRIEKRMDKVEVELDSLEKGIYDYLKDQFNDLSKLGIEVVYPNLDSIPDGTSSKKPRIVSTLPVDPSQYQGVYVYVTSGVYAGQTFYSDGSEWIPQHPEMSYRFKQHLRITGESVDGWTIESDFGTIEVSIGKLEFDTGQQSGIAPATEIRTGDAIVRNSRNPSFKCKITPDYDSGQMINILVYNINLPLDQWGFRIEDDTIYARITKDLTDYLINLGTITAGSPVELEAKYTYNSNIRFYVNGELEYTETEHLPSDDDAYLEVMLAADINLRRTMTLFYLDLFQEWS